MMRMKVESLPLKIGPTKNIKTVFTLSKRVPFLVHHSPPVQESYSKNSGFLLDYSQLA